MNQQEMIHNYNRKYRPKFNRDLFIRRDEDIIEAIKHVVYCIERNSTFTIKVLEFEVIDDYDEVNHILWEYEDAIVNKNKKTSETKKSAYSKKKKDNKYEYINLDDSDINIIRVKYFIEFNEKNRGLVNDEVTAYIAVPRIVDDFYFHLNGVTYSAMYQIVDASTYNNTASKNSKKQSITFKTVFPPIRVYRYSGVLKNIDGQSIPCIYFMINVFKKSILLMKYLLAKFGYKGCLDFLRIVDISIVKSADVINKDLNYVFPIRNYFIVVPKYLYDNIQIVQSFVYTMHVLLNFMKDATVESIYGIDMYVNALGAEFTDKNPDAIHNKGIALLGSLEFNYDDMTRNDLKLDDEDKADIYRILRWIMYEFSTLRQKDNLDITTKKVRYAEYIASLYASRLATGIYRVSDKGDSATLDSIKKAILIPPMFLINAIIKCELVNYKNCVNDLDSIVALKYTFKGVSGIGEKSNAVSDAYRSIQPSHLGRVDIDSSSNSDPGVSGVLCPYVQLYDGHFSEFKEISQWRDNLSHILDIYKSIDAKTEMCRIINDSGAANKKKSNIVTECASITKSLMDMPVFCNETDEYIRGFDIFGDGYFYLIEED